MNIQDFGIPVVAAIVVICYLIGIACKATSKIKNEWIPVICGTCGGIIGIIALAIAMPDYPASDYITAFAVGVVSGLGAVGINQVIKQQKIRINNAKANDIPVELADQYPEFTEDDEKGGDY